MIAAAELVAGDLVAVEAGDLVPADGRLATAASLEAQNCTDRRKRPGSEGRHPGQRWERGVRRPRRRALPRTPRSPAGSGTMIVTATGMDTEVGRIATMLTTVQRTRSPLQGQLDDLTRKLGGCGGLETLAVILVVGLIRGMSFAELMPSVAVAVSAIPTGLPTASSSRCSPWARSNWPRRRRSSATSPTWGRRRHQPHQHRQDRHLRLNRMDRPGGLLRRFLVRGRRRGLRERGRHPRRSPARRPRTSRASRSSARWPATPHGTAGRDRGRPHRGRAGRPG